MLGQIYIKFRTKENRGQINFSAIRSNMKQIKKNKIPANMSFNYVVNNQFPVSYYYGENLTVFLSLTKPQGVSIFPK